MEQRYSIWTGRIFIANWQLEKAQTLCQTEKKKKETNENGGKNV